MLKMKAKLDKLLIGKKDVVGLVFKFKGRLRGSTRSKKRLVRWGKQYMQDRLSRVNYSTVVIHSKQGSIGVKIARTLIRRRRSKSWNFLKVQANSGIIAPYRLKESFKTKLKTNYVANKLKRNSVLQTNVKPNAKDSKQNLFKFRSIRVRSGKRFISSSRFAPNIGSKNAEWKYINLISELYSKVLLQSLFANTNKANLLANKRQDILKSIIQNPSAWGFSLNAFNNINNLDVVNLYNQYYNKNIKSVLAEDLSPGFKLLSNYLSKIQNKQSKLFDELLAVLAARESNYFPKKSINYKFGNKPWTR